MRRSEQPGNNGAPRAKTRNEYGRSAAKYVQQQRDATERRQRINPRLLILDEDFFDRLMEQQEQGG